MMRHLILTALVLALGACGTSNYSGSPWSRTSEVAEASPSPLAPGNAVPAQPYDYNAVPQPPAGQQESFVIGSAAGHAGTVESVPPAGAVYAVPAPPPVKVGLLVPMSGAQADLGQAMLQAAQLALFDIGHNSFELVPRDAGNTPAEAAKAAQSAIAEGAQLLLGPVFASSVRAVQPVAAGNNVNMVAFSTDWSLAGKNTFIMGFLPFGQVQRVVDYAASRGIRRIGVLAPDNAYGNAVLAAYGNAASRAGIQTVESVRFPENQTDLSDIVKRFTRHDERLARRGGDTQPMPPPPFDAVFLPVGGDRAREIAKLLDFYETGPRSVKLLGTGLWDDAALASEKTMSGAWFAAPAPSQRRDFERKYVDSYGLRPPRLATLAYDATALAAVLARNGFYERGQPAFDYASLTNPNGFAGLDGVFRFRNDGLAERGLAVLEFRDGTIEVLDSAPQTFQRWAGQ